MSRKVVLPLVVVGAAGLAFLAWWALRLPEEAPPENPVDPVAPLSEPKSAEQQRYEIHREPWPFVEFEQDFAELHKPDPGFKSEDAWQVENWEKFDGKVFNLRMEAPKFKDVVDAVNQQAEAQGIGVHVYTLPPYYPDEYPIGDIVLENATIGQVIEILQRRTSETAGCYMTSLGLVIGQEGARQQAQLDVKAARAQEISRNEVKQEVLQREYRPGFQRAAMFQIVKDIRAQTGAEVVVEAGVWARQKVLTWRAAPMPLSQALDRICQEFGAYYRVRDGRVFLLDQ